MALQLNYEVNNSGINASYWRILLVNAGLPDGQNPAVHIEIGGYATQELRQDGKSPLVVLPFDVTAADFHSVLGAAPKESSAWDSVRTAVYDWLKTLVPVDPNAPGYHGPDFSTATDC